MPLVLSNTQYSIEKGQETLHEYDLLKIQQQIILRFLLGKPLITLNVSACKTQLQRLLEDQLNFVNLYMHIFLLQGIPTLVNRHDRNYEIILRDVKVKVKQVSYQISTAQTKICKLDQLLILPSTDLAFYGHLKESHS